MVANPSGGYILNELLRHLLGEARYREFGAWFFILAGSLMPVLLPMRISSISKVKGTKFRLWPGVIVGLVSGAALVALGAVMLPSKNELAIPAIQDAGGAITRDEKLPGKPVVRVDFEMGFKKGYNLASLRPHLESLPELRSLRISSWAQISDADLIYLEALTQLETMELYGSSITEAGIERLRKKLPNVRIYYSLGRW
jgi:hypothetical protein